ncbi:hypothetical protein PFISCL1PPCAC_8366, partial [Pristionchus fissidentatus]
EREMYGSPEDANQRYIAIFGTRTRFVVMILVLLCLTSIWSNILTFNFAVICMAPKPVNETADPFGNLTDQPDTYSYTKAQNSWITSVVAIAALICNQIVVAIVNRVGIRTVFTLLGLTSAVATILMPTAIRAGYVWLLVARVFQGIGFAGNFPVIGAFCSRWTYFKQTGFFVSVLVAYVQLSPAITNPVSGALCTAFSWSSVFYSHGVVCLVLFVVYGIFYRNSPQKHPFVGPVETGKIATGKATVDKKMIKVIPYWAIMKTPAVWAVWIAAIGNFTAVNLMFLYSPIYLSAVLGFSTHSTGFSAAIPPLAQFLMKLICGFISDRIKFISEVNKFRVFNSVAFIGSAICFAVLACMSSETKYFNMLLIGGAAGILGATTGGFFKAGPVISKQYSHFVTGNISLMLTLTMIVVPFIVNALTPNNTQDEWRWVFVITLAVQVVTDIFFCIFIRGDACEWTEDEWIRRNTVVDCSENTRKPTEAEH